MLSYSRSRCSLARHVRFASDNVPAQRRAQNLSERYRRLDNTTERAAHVSLLTQTTAVDARTPTPPDTIAGFVIPKEPRAPADDECCMSGCAVCVYDLYEEALDTYKESVTTLRTSLSVLHIPESEWPAHIRTRTGQETSTTSEKYKDAVLSAFEEMERALKEKRDKRAVVEAEKRARGDVLTDDGERVRLDLRGVYEGLKWTIFPNR